VLVSAELPGDDGEPVGDNGQEMVGEIPPDRVAVNRSGGRRFRWERCYENRDPSGGQAAAPQLGKIRPVVAEQVGLDRVAVGG